MTKYGDPKNLVLDEIDTPSPKTGEVLVEIKATAINDWDWSLITGRPYVYRLLFGIIKPKFAIPGIELAGIVRSLGQGVNKFKIGDRVYGDISNSGWGTFAEFGCFKVDDLVAIPDGMPFTDATAIPHAAMLAYQGLIDVGNLESGQKILINGAGGGMGVFAVQIAKTFNVEITGVDSEAKLGLMKELGFDHVIDYKKSDFTKEGKQYDLILDAKTTRNPAAYLKALKSNGKYVTVGGYLNRLLQLFITNKLGEKKVKMVGLKQNKDLDKIHELYASGNIKPIIDGPYPLNDVPKLISYFGNGLHKGKIIIGLE